MPRIKIIKAPSKLPRSQFGGECPEGQIKDEFGNCVPDFNAQPYQQKIGTGIPNITTHNIKNPNKAFAPATSFNTQVPSMQMPQSGFDIWSNPTDISGQSANAMNMPKQTIVDSQGNRTTKGVVDIGNPTLYEAQKTPTYPKKQNSSGFGKEFLNTAGWLNSAIDMGGAAINYFDNKRKQKEYDNWARQSRLPDNYYAVNTTQDRGDYDINNGMFRPDDMGYKSKGTQANAYYPQQGFAEYGGMIKAAEGVDVPYVGEHYIPAAHIDLPPSMMQPQIAALSNASAPVVMAKGNDIATRTNNPGNLLYKPVFGKLFGAVDSGIKQLDGSGTFAAFPDIESGLNAREAQMFGAVDGTFNTKIYKPTLTVDQALRKWSNNGYGGNIYPEIANKTLAEVTPQERKELLKRQIKAESGSMYRKLTEEGLLKYGGQNDKNMKVRIVSTPDEQTQMAYGGQPPYSGQSDYGLYIGQRNLYKTMAKHPYDDVKSTVSEEPETPDNPHVLEAEGGEIITKPDGTTSKIVGDRHYEGGEKLNKEQAPEGSFIFSDTAKMKIGGRALANFGKSVNSKKKYTPAELAKQYDVNKYKAILADPTTDNLQKNTAKRMLDAYTQKLAELALVQEDKKGFPQGVPDIAKPLMEKLTGGANGMEQAEGENPEEEQMEQPPMQYGGGLKKFQGIIGGSTVRNVQYKNKNYVAPQVPKDYNLSGYNQYESIPSGAVYLKPGQPGYTAAGSYNQAPVRGSAPWKPFVKSLAEKGMTYEDLVKYNPGVGRHVNDRPDVKAWWQQNYKAIPGKTVPATDPSFVYQQEPNIGGGIGTTTPGPKPIPTPNPNTNSITPNDFTPGEGKYPPYGWTQQDINNVGAAATNLSLIDKYNMASRSVQPVLPEFIPTDWRGYAATQQSGANKAADQLGTYQPGQGMASNLSFLAGQQAGALGDYISKVDQYNASGASNMDLQRANILNTASQYNASKRDYDMDYNNTADARYKAALAHGLDRLTAAGNQGITNAAMLYDMNVSESPEYYIDPRFQKRKFNSTQAYWDFINKNKGGYQDSSGSNDIAIYNDAYTKAQGTPAEKAVAALKAMELQGSRSKSTNTTYPYNTKRNNTRTTRDITESKFGGQQHPGYSYFNPFLR